MLSPAFNLEQFVEKVRGEDYFGIVYAAEQEATEAERLSLRLQKTLDPDFNKSKSYADTLKKLINYLRYGFLPFSLEDYQYALFKIVYKEMSHKKSFHSR